MKRSLLLSGLVIAAAGAIYAEELVAPPQLLMVCMQAQAEDQELCKKIGTFIASKALEVLLEDAKKEAPSEQAFIDAFNALADRHHLSVEQKKQEMDLIRKSMDKEELLRAKNAL